ncbi:MAG: DUF5318 family protein [Solirubrobacteraceae bacterium]
MTFRASPSDRGGAAERQASVEYRLVRDTLVRDVRRGRVSVDQVCDAHPELLRAARHVGVALGAACPICEDARVVQITYVFGAGLPAGGRCPGNARELDRLRRGSTEVTCYDVEVCPGCSWHHLLRKYPAGGGARGAGRAGRRA